MIAVAIITAIINELPVDRLRALPLPPLSAPLSRNRHQRQLLHPTKRRSASAVAVARSPGRSPRLPPGRSGSVNKGGRPRSKPIETTTSAMTNGHDPDDGWKESVRAVHGISNRAAAAN